MNQLCCREKQAASAQRKLLGIVVMFAVSELLLPNVRQLCQNKDDQKEPEYLAFSN